jgi:UDP-glucose 4-epimerase
LSKAESLHQHDNSTLHEAARSFNETLLRNFKETYGLRYVALRHGNVYGPRMDAHGGYAEMLIRWMESIEAGEPPPTSGNGPKTLDLINVRDLARAHVQAAMSDAHDGVFDVASGVETSLNMLAEHLANAMDPSADRVHVLESKVDAASNPRADTADTKEPMGFTAEINLTEGPRGMVQWWRQEQCRPVARLASR